MKRKLKNRTEKGNRSERLVMKQMQRRKWLVIKSDGSRGPCDLVAIPHCRSSKTGLAALILVSTGDWSTTTEQKRLVRACRQFMCLPMFARVDGKRITWK